jgi:hypothetical protein
MKHRFAIVVALTAPLIGAAVAHHSAAQFELSKLAVIDGTVAKLQWTNPHVFVQLLVADESGKTVEWSLEGPNPGGLARAGWNSQSLRAGDKINVTFNPLRAGGPAGFFLAIKLPNGNLLGQTDVALMRIKNALAATGKSAE